MAATPLSQVGILSAVDFQRVRTVPNQVAQVRPNTSGIQQRAFTTPVNRTRPARDANGSLIGRGILIDRRS